MADARIKEIIAKRGTIKGQITSVKTFLSKCAASPTHVDNITRRINLLKTAYQPFEGLCDELQTLDEVNAETHESARFEIQANYLDLLDDADDLIRTLQAPFLRNDTGASGNGIDLTALGSGVLGSGVSSMSSSAGTPPTDNAREAHITLNGNYKVQRRRLKLPDAPIPTFTGEYEDWLPFKDSFNSVIDNFEGLSGTDKLHYLKGAMIGKAAGKLRSLPAIDGNYERAWGILEKAYADKRLIVSKHLNLILNMPTVQRETSENLQKLADETTQNIESLAALGIHVTEEIVVQNLENKLPKTTAEKWEETQKRGVFPKLEDLIEFIYTRAARASSNDTQKGFLSQNHKKSNTGNNKGASQTFVTSATDYNCPNCDGKHQLYRCSKFKELTIPQRIQTAEQASVCLLCLRAHRDSPCKFNKCVICDRKENFLLHEHQAMGRD